jgi:hypothetical protein
MIVDEQYPISMISPEDGFLAPRRGERVCCKEDVLGWEKSLLEIISTFFFNLLLEEVKILTTTAKETYLVFTKIERSLLN